MVSETGQTPEQYILKASQTDRQALTSFNRQVGFGTIVGSVLVGSLMTTDYKAVQATYNTTRGRPRDSELSPSKDLPADFPLERARLRHVPWLTALFVASLALYGFAMDAERLPGELAARPAWIVVPLLLQFLIAASSNGIVTIYLTLISDLCHGQGAGSTAISNLVSQLLNAGGVAFVEPLLETWGPVYLYLGFAAVGVVYVALAAANWYLGAAEAEEAAGQGTRGG